jgi:hypothetical protein
MKGEEGLEWERKRETEQKYLESGIQTKEQGRARHTKRPRGTNN